MKLTFVLSYVILRFTEYRYEYFSGRRYKIKPVSGLVSNRFEAVHQDGFFIGKRLTAIS